ncbi:unnamed protein product [Protopolystoma xenopodis]|uniref:Uncharacterized protein n=1 Tax=Protopolystoma xenopodis TaxID=117903 RepID=A0A448XBF1_9PLAT|nr:unnamed protein product [Protopolystoma xenopodis]
MQPLLKLVPERRGNGVRPVRHEVETVDRKPICVPEELLHIQIRAMSDREVGSITRLGRQHKNIMSGRIFKSTTTHTVMCVEWLALHFPNELASMTAHQDRPEWASLQSICTTSPRSRTHFKGDEMVDESVLVRLDGFRVS